MNLLYFGIVYISPKAEILKIDPSEGVRSSEITQIVKEYFHEVEVRLYSGGILMHILGENFFTNFDVKNPLHTKYLEILSKVERHFMETGEISIENAYIIARK